MELKDLTHLLLSEATESTEKVLLETGIKSSVITKADAYRIYGRFNVDRWIHEGLLSLAVNRSKTSKKFIDKIQLETIAASSNRITYLPIAERQR